MVFIEPYKLIADDNGEYEVHVLLEINLKKKFFKRESDAEQFFKESNLSKLERPLCLDKDKQGFRFLVCHLEHEYGPNEVSCDEGSYILRYRPVVYKNFVLLHTMIMIEKILSKKDKNELNDNQLQQFKNQIEPFLQDMFFDIFNFVHVKLFNQKTKESKIQFLKRLSDMSLVMEEILNDPVMLDIEFL